MFEPPPQVGHQHGVVVGADELRQEPVDERHEQEQVLEAALVGGKGSLTSPKPLKTVGSYWPYATTLFDYVRRAMPLKDPGTLTPAQVYAVSAYILNLNGIIGENEAMNAQTLPKVKMPNRDNFIPDPRPDTGKKAARKP